MSTAPTGSEQAASARLDIEDTMTTLTTTGTTTQITLPSLGESVTEATVTRWLKDPGQPVREQEPLLEVATDKVDTEIASTTTGVLGELLVAEGDVVAVGAPVATVETGAVTPGPAESPGVDTERVPEPLPPVAESRPTPVTHAADESAGSPETNTAPAGTVSEKPAGTVTEKLPRIRRTIAERMMSSLHTSAQLTTVVEIDVTSIAVLRRASKDEFRTRTGLKLSFLPFFAKAAVEALAEHRVINAAVDPDVTEITYHDGCHLGMAVDGPKGLLVPVISNAQNLSISGLARAIADKADRARSGSISPDELGGGTFTLTNTGSRGALFDTPIINQPQSAILGTGAVVERLVPIRGDDGDLRVEVRSMVYFAISYDHRIVDGADAAGFLMSVKNRLERGFDESVLS